MAFFSHIRHNRDKKPDIFLRKEDVYVDCQKSFGTDPAVGSGF